MDEMDDSASVMTRLPLIQSPFFPEFKPPSPRHVESQRKPQKLRPTIMQKLNEKYAERLRDNGLVCTRRLATLGTRAATLQMGGKPMLGGDVFNSAASSPWHGVEQPGAFNNLAASSMATVEVLELLRRRKQLLLMKKLKEGDTGPSESPLHESPRSAHLPSHCGSLIRRPGSRSGSPAAAQPSATLDGSQRTPAMQQLAFQDLRRAAEISSSLELTSHEVSVSTALDPKVRRSWRTPPSEHMAPNLGCRPTSMGLLPEGSRAGTATTAATTRTSASSPGPTRTGSRESTISSAKLEEKKKAVVPSAPTSKPSIPRGKKSGSRSGSRKKSRPKSRSKQRGPNSPVHPLLRVGGPVAPFYPGIDVPPHQWLSRDRENSKALVQLNAAGFDRKAAFNELSAQAEASERAAAALSYVAMLPKDQCADALLRGSMQEMRYRRPFLQVPILELAKAARTPLRLPHASQAAAPSTLEAGEPGLAPRIVNWTFNPESSVFGPRRHESDAKAMHDTPAVLTLQLGMDWRHLVVRDQFRRFVSAEDVTVKDGSCKTDRALEAIREVLAAHANTLRSVFAYYATMSLDLKSSAAGARLSISFDQWRRILSDMMVVDERQSIHCSSQNCETAFYTSLAGPASTMEGPASTTESRDNKTLSRWQWYEAMVRVAALKYVRIGPHNSLAEGLNHLIEKNLCQASLPPEALDSIAAFRDDRLYQQDTDLVLRKRMPLLRTMFERGCELTREGAGQGLRTVTLHGWLLLLRECGLLDIHVPDRDAALLFTWSFMVVTSEALHPEAAYRLRWTDFIEAVCRLADLLSPPPLDELEVLLREVLMLPAEDLAVAMATKPWHKFYSKIPADKIATFRRSSARFCVEKSQRLGDKINAALEHLESLIMKEPVVSLASSACLPVEESNTGCLPLEETAGGCPIVEEAVGGCLTAEETAGGCLTVEETTPDCLPVKKSDSGCLPVEQTAVGCLIGKGTAGDSTQVEETAGCPAPIEETAPGCPTPVEETTETILEVKIQPGDSPTNTAESAAV